MNAPLDVVMGWTVDFGDVKQIFDPIFKSMDHRPLLEVDGLHDGNVASVAEWVMEQAGRQIPSLTRVDLYETPGCGSMLATGIDGPTMPV